MPDRQSAPVRRKRGKPTAIDVHVGRRIRERRLLLGLSQEKLGESVGLTFQQIQKYERGTNRVGAGRLVALGTALDVPVGYFFDGMPEIAGDATDGEPPSEFVDPMSRRETQHLVAAYYAIPDPSVRRRMLDLVRSLASADDLAGD